MGDAADDAERRADQEREDPGVQDADADAPTEDDAETALVPAEIADEVGQAIALREQAVVPTSSIPLPAEWNAMEVMATRLAHSRVVPEQYRGRPDDVIAAWLFGRELGLGQMTALRDIYMIEGKASIAAHRQLGLMRAGAKEGRGIVLLESETTMERAMIKAQRTDTGEIMTVEFTWEEAQKIKRKGKLLVDGDNWRNYRPDMLWARCVGRLSRRLGSDLISALPPYVAEEVADFSGWGVEYGENNALTLRADAVREESRPPWNRPESWVELGERCARILGAAEWDAWRLEILQQAYGASRVSDLGTPSSDAVNEVWGCFQAFLRELDQWEPQHEIDPIPRAVVKQAVSHAFGGVEVGGPPWRITPDETKWPARGASPGVPDPGGAPEQSDAYPNPPTDEAIEDAEVVTPEEQAELDRQDAEYRQSLSDDIDTLLAEVDTKRRVETGTTYREIAAHYGKPTEASTETLEEISESLSAYSLLTAAAMEAATFVEYCESQQQISFG